jgi:hypothetical protein
MVSEIETRSRKDGPMKVLFLTFAILVGAIWDMSRNHGATLVWVSSIIAHGLRTIGL